MQLNVVDDLGEAVGKQWLQAQAAKSHGAPFRIALPLSSTPLPIYRWALEHANHFAHWEACEFLLMDEQVEGQVPPYTYVSTADPASYLRFAHERLLNELRRRTNSDIPVAMPELATLQEFQVRIDFLVLAIGPSGNYANVMPGTPLDTGWHVAELTGEFRSAHTSQDSKSYAGASFRTHGMSLGPTQVLESREIVIVATGEKKRQWVEQLLGTPFFDPQFPISVVHHEGVRDRVRMFVTPDTVSHSG